MNCLGDEHNKDSEIIMDRKFKIIIIIVCIYVIYFSIKTIYNAITIKDMLSIITAIVLIIMYISAAIIFIHRRFKR